jgi:hypothetical protein
MSKTQLIRKSFNAGELSPELHYRDDLEAYVKGCKHLTNMTATPYGAVTRRPPFEVLTRIDAVLYGVPIRYIPFKFSLTEVFHIVFTDGSGTESTDPTTADLIIFDENGDKVFFDGGATTVPLSGLPLALNSVAPSPVGALNSGTVALANTIYDPADLHKIHYINVNDYVYLTCGGEYPLQAINRFFDKDEGGNRWNIAEWEFIGGPLEDRNEKQDSTVTVTATSYSSSDTYSSGDDVANSEAFNLDSGNGAYWDDIGGDLNTLNLYFTLENGHNVSVGDTISVGNFGITDASDFYSTGTSTQSDAKDGPPVPSQLLGTYQVSSVSGNTIYFGFQVRCRTKSNKVFPALAYSSASIVVGAGFYYKSTKDNNTGNPLTDTNFWRATNSVNGLIDVTSSAPIFTATDVGRQIAISTQNLINPNASWSANTVGEPFIGQGSIELKTEGGSWGGLLELQQSVNGGSTWVTIGEIRSIAGSYNGSIDRLVKDPASILRVVLSEYGEASGDPIIKACVWSITFLDEVNVYATISSVISPYLTKATLTTPLFSPITDYRWSLGVFSDTTGYPFSLTIHDERLCLGGSKAKPNTVYASRVNDWNNYLKGSLETSPYTFTVAADSFDTIRSLKSSRQLNILTDNAENTMGSRDDNAITSISNISVSSHTNYGSNEVQAIQLADMIWFVMGQGERVRASKYDFASDGQQSIEMSLFASHITESGIKEMSFRRHPYNSLFCLLNNGTGATLTYEGMQEVRAWSTVSTDGQIISAASNYSDTGDIVAGIVKRDNIYFLEKFGGVTDDTVFLDNQTTWVGADFDAGQDIEQFDDGNLIVVADDTELVRDIDYTIETVSVAATNPFIDGFGDAYFDLTPPFGAAEVPSLVLFEDGVQCPCGSGEYSFFVDNGQAVMWIKSDYYNPAVNYVVKNTLSTLVIPTVKGSNVLPSNCGVVISPSVSVNRVTIGRRIETRVNPTDISEVAPSGMVKRLTELSLYLLDSGTCNVKINGKESPFTDGLGWAAGQRESGLFELTTGGDYEQGLDVDITIDNHRHFTLTGLGYRLGISQG